MGNPQPLNPEQRNAVAQRVLRARVRLALLQPFLATALMRLPVREVPDTAWCPTAATDGYHIFYNPQWVNTLSDAELRGLMAHEVLHVLFTHADRRRQRDPGLWNVACDFAINQLLVDRGFRLPKGGLVSDQAKGKTSEQLYAELEKLAKAQASNSRAGKGERGRAGKAKGGANGGGGASVIPRYPGQKPNLPSGRASGCGVNGSSSTSAARTDTADGADTDLGDAVPEVGDDLLDPDDPRVRPLRSADAPDPEQLEELRRELREDALARLQGDAAGRFKEECQASAEARIDWRALLRAWLSDRIKGDWTNFPFSKRWVHRGLFMPSPGLQVPGHVVFAIDTSGSMDSELLAQMVGELRAFREVFPCRLSVIQCDARIQDVQEFEAMDGYEIPEHYALLGRGGTDFRPVFEWVEQHAAGAVVLYVTDGLGSFPTSAPSSPTIWLTPPPHASVLRVPFGEVVRVGS